MKKNNLISKKSNFENEEKKDDSRDYEGENALNMGNKTYNNMQRGLQGLHHQREQLISIQNRADRIDERMNMFDQLTEVMKNETLREKMKYLFGCVVLIIGNFVLLILKFK